VEYEVQREDGQYHVIERGQTTRGTTLTDGWLRQMGFWPLSRLNLEHAMNATMAMAGGMILDQYAARHPLRQPDISFTPRSASYPTRRMQIPERLMIRG